MMRDPFDDRVLESAEARRYLDAPITKAERDDVLALVRWFQRRYPTPIERPAYARRAYLRWRRTTGLAASTRLAESSRRGPTASA